MVSARRIVDFNYRSADVLEAGVHSVFELESIVKPVIADSIGNCRGDGEVYGIAVAEADIVGAAANGFGERGYCR